jgi:segregation and condensation protein B
LNAAQIVEAVLFASDAPLHATEIARADPELDEDIVEEAIDLLRVEYDDAERAFQIVEIAEGYQILTRPEFNPYLERFDTVPRPSRLSGPALEALAIIAYRQPIGRIEIEYVRGVNSSGVIRTLQERGLIDVVGRAEGVGRPLLYGTTARFLEHFGFRALEDLPRPEDLPVVLRERVPLGPEEPEESPTEWTAPSESGAAADGADAKPDSEAEGAASGPPASPSTGEPVATQEAAPEPPGGGPAPDLAAPGASESSVRAVATQGGVHDMPPQPAEHGADPEPDAGPTEGRAEDDRLPALAESDQDAGDPSAGR